MRIRVLFRNANDLIVKSLAFLVVLNWANIGHFLRLPWKFSLFRNTKSTEICLRKPEYCVVMADNVLLISIFPVLADRCERTAAGFKCRNVCNGSPRSKDPPPYSIYFFLPHLGRMSRKISKFKRGMGRASTERYSSLSRFLTAALTEKSAHGTAKSFSTDISFIKYGGTYPEIV